MAYARVQFSGGGAPNTSDGSTNTVTSGGPFNPVGAGNTLVGFVYMQDSSVTNLSVVDSNAAAVNSVLLGHDALVTQNRLGIFWKTGVTGGPTSVTVTATGPTTLFQTIWLEEWSGFIAGSVSDGTGFANLNTTTAANSLATSAVVTTQPGDFIWSLGIITNGPDTLTVGTVPAYTISLSSGPFISESFTQISAGSITGTYQATGASSVVVLGILTLTQGAVATGVPFTFLHAPLLMGVNPTLYLGGAALAKFLRRAKKNLICSRRSIFTGNDDR